MAGENDPQTAEQPSLSDQESEKHSPREETKDEKDRALIRLALRKSPFFTCLDEEQVERFIEVAKLKRYTGGHSIILEGCVDDFEIDQENSRPAGPANRQPVDKLREEEDADEGLAESDEYFEDKLSLKDETEQENGREAMSEDDEYVLVGRPSRIPKENQGQNFETIEEASTAQTDKEQENPQEPLSSEESTEKQEDDTLKQEPEKNHSESSTETKDTENNKDLEPQNSVREDPKGKNYLEPPPPKSGVPSYLYIVRNGQADVMYSRNVNPATLGSGSVFGEGGFLFGRQHSASVLASSDTLECYVVDANTFRNDVLPSTNMKKRYNDYARHIDEHNLQYMTMQDFVNSCLDDGSAETNNGNDSGTEMTLRDPLASVRIANTFNILRNDKAGGLFSQKITLPDFCLFHLLMARPDPEVDITFLLIDEHKRGVLYKEDIANFLKSSFEDLEFNMESEFIQRHFGKDDNNQRCIRPKQFPQFLVDLRREIGQQTFLQELERNGTTEGYLPPDHFVGVLKTAPGWRLPDGVAERLESVYCKGPVQAEEAEALVEDQKASEKTEVDESPNAHSITVARERSLGERYFTYCDFLAFQEVLGQLPGICSLIDRACEIKKGPVSPDDFKVANQVLGFGGRLSRKQVDIIFQLFDLDGDGLISHHDTVAIAGVDVAQRVDAVPGREGSLIYAHPPKSRHEAEKGGATGTIGALLEYFALTAITSAIGVITLYPLDLIKTRMMNERVGLDGKRMYQHSLDCLQITIRSEGALGLYRGLIPQLVGVAPEKMIKLAVHDLLRQSLNGNFDDPERSSYRYLLELFAGGCAGACQLPVTNPTEIVKIRLQLQGETARILQAKGFNNPVPQSLSAIVSSLGYSGLYTGARACLLRDIPFSAIYFPTYSLFKEHLARPEGPSTSVSASNLLLAGTLAGVPASLLTTPADVIKTRLQVIPRPGESSYEGIRDCFTKVYEKEGASAFFRGSTMRVARISPQFGIALFAYEQISQLIGNKGFSPPTNAPVDPKDYLKAFPTRAINSKTEDRDRLLKNLGRPGSDRN